MDTRFFMGMWNRVAGTEGYQTLEIDGKLQLKDRNKVSLQLHVDKRSGTLIDEDGDVSMTYWQRSTAPRNLLLGIAVTPGKAAAQPWRLWGGELGPIEVPLPPGLLVNPSLRVTEFLDGIWHVRTEEGHTGGRHGGYVIVVAGEKPDDHGNFMPGTRFWLCYSEHPTGPWIRYDVMTFNSETASLDSIHGGRTISFLKRDRPPWRVIYAMYYQLPGWKRMPFEVGLSGVSGDDGTGAWGAEGG